LWLGRRSSLWCLAAEGFADTKNPAKVSTKLNNAKKKFAETEQAEKS
jgi:hypothetical protein